MYNHRPGFVVPATVDKDVTAISSPDKIDQQRCVSSTGHVPRLEGEINGQYKLFYESPVCDLYMKLLLTKDANAELMVTSQLNQESRNFRKSDSDSLIETLVCNLAPNRSGTYTPFGESSVDNQLDTKFVSSVSHNDIFDNNTSTKVHVVSDLAKSNSELPPVELKQSRLSYSYVLTKPVASDKSSKEYSKEGGNITKTLRQNKRTKTDRNLEFITPDIDRYFSASESATEPNHDYVGADFKTSASATQFEPLSEQYDDVFNNEPDNLASQNKNASKSYKFTKINNVKYSSVLKDTDVKYYNMETINNETNDKQVHFPNAEKGKLHKKCNKLNIRSNNKQHDKNKEVKKSLRPRKNKRSFDLKRHFEQGTWWFTKITSWFFALLWDVIVMSSVLWVDMGQQVYESIKHKCHYCIDRVKLNSFQNIGNWFDRKLPENSNLAFWRKFSFYSKDSDGSDDSVNLNLAKTREEAMQHLSTCKDKDPYSTLCLDPNCKKEQIRRHYKRLAMLVHPDKNNLPGAEEAFKVLQRAFDLIGEPDQRAVYHRELARRLQAEIAFNQFGVLLTELQDKLQEVSNSIRCNNCNGRHARFLTGRPSYAARECGECKIRHSAKEGEIWAESRMYGLRWVYMACMEGNIYDVSKWVTCQKHAFAGLTANAHNVQYRIVLGSRPSNQQQRYRNSNIHLSNNSNPAAATGAAGYEEFIYNMYTTAAHQQQTGGQDSTRRRSARYAQ